MGNGYYFDGDYPEQYEDQIDHLQDLLRRQLHELEKNDPAQDAATIGFLRGRRSSQRDLVQIEIANLERPRVLVASREVILDAAEWSKPEVQDEGRKAGFNDHGGVCGRFVRLVNRRTHRSEAADRITKQGQRNTLAVTASVGKGIGGPDPVSNPLPAESRTFESYRESAPAAASDRSPIVAVIDTGIPGDAQDGLPTMIRNDGWLHDVPRNDTNRDLLDSLPERDGYLDYQAGHGTFVAGVVARVAPRAEVRVYRVADTDGFADDIAVADALRRAVADGATVINLSLGMVTCHDVPPPALAEAVREVTATGNVVIVAAAGNFGDDTKCWPACLPEVITVGALVESEEVGENAPAGRTGKFETARWSSWGDHVDFWTVAEGVRSTFVTGCESPLFDNQPAVFPENAWALWSGTSFAAPQIAGAIARIRYELGKTLPEAVDFLREKGAAVSDVDGNVKAGKGLRILSGIPVPRDRDA